MLSQQATRARRRNAEATSRRAAARPQRRGRPRRLRLHTRFRPSASARVSVAGAPAPDEDQAFASARSAPVSLLHRWKGSGAVVAIEFHALRWRRVTRRWPLRVQSNLMAFSRPEEGIMSELLLDATGRRRSPATPPEFHAGRWRRDTGMRSHRTAHDRGDRHGHALGRVADAARAMRQRRPASRSRDGRLGLRAARAVVDRTGRAGGRAAVRRRRDARTPVVGRRGPLPPGPPAAVR
jgi:hypothetical protein